MHLSDYMAAKGLTDEQVAADVGTTRVSVSRYRRKLERPSWKMVDRFTEWSGGEITAIDWPPPTTNAPEQQAAACSN